MRQHARVVFAGYYLYSCRMEKRSARLTQGSVGRHLVDMTVPMLLGITTMMAQSFIDTYFLGMVGDRALAAYSFGFPILMIVTSVAIGLGAGTSSVVARAIGADDHERAQRLATDSMILSLIVAGVCALIGVLTIDPLFRRMGAPDDDAAVVAPDLRLRGLDGIRVADNSIMPFVTNGNTHAPAILIGEKAFDLISADERTRGRG